MILSEDKRQELISKQKAGRNYKDQSKGRNRYQRRIHSKISSTVRQYNSIDMNKLFKDDILTVNISVNGETDNYVVRMSFGGFLEILRDRIKMNHDILDYRTISQALVIGFNKDDCYIHCTCPDWKYRMAFFATRGQINSGDPENRPSNITNPHNDLGPGCKHVALCLTNAMWVTKVASVINNYINYMQKHYERMYADIIYPAIYGKPYEEPVQTSIFDTDDLANETDTDTLDKANEYGQKRTQFQKGNTQGVRFAGNDPEQISMDDEISDDSV